MDFFSLFPAPFSCYSSQSRKDWGKGEEHVTGQGKGRPESSARVEHAETASQATRFLHVPGLLALSKPMKVSGTLFSHF